MADKPAIINNLRVIGHSVYARCEVWHFDVWGNAREGWDVNDRSCAERDARIPVEIRISNVPRFPGAKDAYRSFSESSSFSTEMMISFEIPDREIRGIFGPGVEAEGDGEHITVSQKRNGKPIGEIIIVGWAEEK